MELLVILAGQAGETVNRDTLINEIWQGSYGGDEVLSRIISILRNQLGDNSRNPVYIETVPKVGYRLIVHPSPVIEAEEQWQPKSAPKAAIAAISLMLLLSLTYGLYKWGPLGQQTIPRYTIAVLPYLDIGENQENQFFSVGLTDEIILSLNRSPLLRIVSRRSLTGTQSTIPVGDVDFYIEGTVRFTGDRVRIVTELKSADENIVVWSDSYESQADEYLDIQRNLSASIINGINAELDLDIQLQPRAEIDLAAYTHFLNGHFLSKLRGNEPLLASIDEFLAALDIEPSFDSARLGLANSYALLPYYSEQNEDAALTLASEQLGTLQQPDSADADAIRGFIAFRQWRWLEAEQYFQKSIDSQENIANTHVWYSQFLSAVGRPGEALNEAQLAYDLDPVSPVVNDRLAVTNLWLNQDEEARRLFNAGANLGFVNRINTGYLLLLVRNRDISEIQQILRGLHSDGALEPIIEQISAMFDIADREEFVVLSERLIQEGALQPRLEFGWWVILEEWERAYRTLVKYAGEKKNIDVEFLYASESEGFRGSPFFDDVIGVLNLDSYWQNVGRPELLTAGI